MAIACLRLFTFPPLPDFSVPNFLRCTALFTLLPAAFLYLRPLLFLVALRISLRLESDQGPLMKAGV